MSGRGSLLTRGRGAVFTVAGAIVVWLVAGMLRQSLISLLTLPVLAIPWLWVRRVAVGVLFDIPTAFVAVALILLAAKLIVFRPLPASLALVAAVWTLDLLVAWLVSNDLSLWHDPLSVTPRVLLAAAALFGAAYALGWRRGRQTPEGAEEIDANESEHGDSV
jgi:hypothetical protein